MSNLRPGFLSTKKFSYVLFQAHFEDHQFLGTVNGRRSLKPNAVPTLFNHKKPVKKRKGATRRGLASCTKLPSIGDHTYYREKPQDLQESNLLPDSYDQDQPCTDIDFSVRVSQPISFENACNLQSDFFLESTNDPQPMETTLGDDIYDNLCQQPYGTFAQGVNLSCPQSCHDTNIKLKQKIEEQRLEILALREAHDRKENICLKEAAEAKDREIALLKKTLRRVNLEKNKMTIKKGKKRKRGQKGNRWTNEEIRKALQIKIACGQSGYNVLLQQGYELPSISTLYKHTEHFSFKPGILDEVFQMLEVKVKDMNLHERKCVLTLDEMTLKVGWNFDPKLGSCYGGVTLPGHSGTATHALAFMLGGLTTHWKQCVAYHLTPDSVDGSTFNKIIEEIILKAKSIGLKVVSVTSDMGGSNQKMWLGNSNTKINISTRSILVIRIW